MWIKRWRTSLHWLLLWLAGANLIAAPSSAPAEGSFRFLVWGDATDVLEFVVTNAAQIRQLDVQPAFNLFAGDLYDTGFSLESAQALRSAIDGDSNRYLSGTMLPVRGNHDIIGGSNALTGWQAYFDVAKRISGGDPGKGVPGVGGTNYSCLVDSVSYSFDFQNSHFVGLDIVGDVTLVTDEQLSWLDADLTAAEARGLQHAFLWWHGPVYSCGNRHGGVDAPDSLIAVLNQHPIVSAVFGGHAHVFAWTHMYTNRISSITHPFEAFIVPPVAENLAAVDNTNRCDFGLGNRRGFTTVDVNGAFYTVSLFIQDDPQPRFTRTFPVAPKLKSATPQHTNAFAFTLTGEPGRRYHIETSTDLLNWLPLFSQMLYFPGTEDLIDSQPNHPPQRFYRCWPDP
jgi:hypothetical protein